jgi:hypothetical protein
MIRAASAATMDDGERSIVPTPGVPPLLPYWIEFAPRDWFEVGEYEMAPSPPRAFGVTAASLDDALALVRTAVFGDEPLPPIVRVVEHVDLVMLAIHNMSPGILPPGQPGIWYPAIAQERIATGQER